jgi:RHS repeat-associated protein
VLPKPGDAQLPYLHFQTKTCFCADGLVINQDTGWCVPGAPLPPKISTVSPESCSADGVETAKPIIPATGEKHYTHSDYEGGGPQGLTLERTYRSRWSVNGLVGFAANPGLGTSWAHNHSDALQVIASTSATLIQGNGSTSSFIWNTSTTSWTAASGTSTLATTVTPIAGYLLTRAEDDSTWQFDAAGKLLSKTERNGWVSSYSYVASGVGAGQLASVTNAFGRSISFAYNAAGQLVSATLPDGQTVGYVFDSALRLSAVVYAGNVSKTYLYEDSRWPHSVTGVVDERGIRLATVVYDAQGRAVESGYAGGADNYKVAYPAATNWASAKITDPLGTTRSYNYGSTLGKLTVTGADKPSGSGGSDAASRVQNASGLVDSETDFAGVLTMYTWDSTRRLPLSTTQAAGRPEALITSTQWHPTWRLPVLVTEPGKTTATTYDARGNAVSQTETDTSNGLGSTWAWKYTANNLVATQTGPLGHIWTFAYDTKGSRTSATNPLGQTTSYAYDNAGRLVQSTESSGLSTAYSYDLSGRITQISQSGSGITPEVTRYSYTAAGQLASATLPDGYQASYSYDAAQRLVGISDNRGNTTSYTLDGMGNRIREELKDPGGSIAWATSRVVNSLNRVSSIANAQGQSTQFGFDANGQAVRQTDPLGHSSSQTLDALRRPVATTLPDSSSTRTAWSALGDLASAQDPKGITTTYQRNAWGEVLVETSPDSGTTTYARDAAGNVSSRTDALGKTTTYQRDALGRPSTITLSNGTTQTLAYDAAGNLAQMVDASGSTSYQYDLLGRLVSKTQTVSDNPANPSSYTATTTYHPGGQIASLRYPSGLQVFYRLGTGSNIGQVAQIDVQEPGKNQPLQTWVTGLAYTALGQPKAWRWNSTDAANRSFDANGRMLSNEFASYSYDAAGRISSITQTLHSTAGPTPITWAAGYDNRDRLTSFTRAGNASQYSYDRNSNRLSAQDSTTSDTDLDGDFDAADLQRTTAQAHTIAQDSNRLLGFTQTNTAQRLNAQGNPVIATSSTQVHYSLDAAGNLTSDGLRSFGYDSNNRLSQVEIGQNTEASKVSYLHNALGQRVFKSEPQVAQTAPDEEELGTDFISWLKKNFNWLFAKAQQNATLGQSYVYADASLGSYNLLGEYGNGAAKGGGRIEYLWLPTDTGLAQLMGLYKGGRFYAVHTDHLGTPRSITDDANQVVWQWAYSAFGDNKPTGILKATANPKVAFTNQPTLLKATNPSIVMNLRFPGQYWDDESKLSYNYLRSYRAAQGRYDQADPIGLEGGWSRYSYVGGNPLGYSDPLGLYTEVIRWANSPGFTGSWGHISGNINGKNYSFAPGGWDTRYPTAQEYADRQKSPDIDREGRGIILDLSPLEEAKLASCLKKASNYQGFSNNCGNPWLQCLDEMGITYSGNRPAVLPEDVMKIIGSSKRAKGNTSYPGKRRLY